MFAGVKDMLSENGRRNRRPEYDPVTGKGCHGKRVCVRIEEIGRDLYLPEKTLEDAFVSLTAKEGGFGKALRSLGMDAGAESVKEAVVLLCETRYREDFEFYAINNVTIYDKTTAELVPFFLNKGQRKVLGVLEDMRTRGVPIRAIVLKARQCGISTLIQQYMNWIQNVHKRNWSSVVCAHTRDSAINIRSMYETSIEHMPPLGGSRMSINAYKGTQNIKIIPQRGCKITVGSAQEPDSVRSQDAKMAHLSETAFYPNTARMSTERLISSIISTIPRLPLTFVAYESTANGIGDFFSTEWTKAEKGESAYRPVFVAWWEMDIYWEAFDGSYNLPSGEKTKGTMEDFALSLDEYEKALFDAGATLEGINWYRGKMREMTSMEKMHQEFPSYAQEAFITTGMPVFRRDDVERMRCNCRQPAAIGDLTAKETVTHARLHPGLYRDVLKEIAFVADGHALALHDTSDPITRYKSLRNRLRVWKEPEKDIPVRNRYVVSVDTGGRGESSDFSCITVLDRYWMIYGGVPEVVARWKGHTDHDILVWTAAQIAEYYCHALLVFESNTEETESRDGDSEEYIFDTIARHYDNLYSRTPADKIREGVPAVWGFHTNTKTKTMVIDNYVSILRESHYIEVDGECLDEALLYERKPNGKCGAMEGHHDDILMSTMIGLYICYNHDRPAVVEERHAARRRTGSFMVI